MNTLTDAELLARFSRDGDREALGALFRNRLSFCYRVAYAVLRNGAKAEEAVQQAFLNLLRRRMTSFDPAAPLEPWLRTVVVRAALDLARLERRVSPIPQEILAAPSEEPSMQAQHAEMKRRLQQEIQALPEELRMPVVLHYQAGCTYGEVAAALRVPPGTVAARLASAKERLRFRLAPAMIVLAAGLSLEEALGATAPEGVPSPGLSDAIDAMIKSVPALRHAVPAAGMRWRKPALAAAGGLLLLVGIGTALRPGKSPAMPWLPEPAVTPVEPAPSTIPVQEPELPPSLPGLAAAAPGPEPATAAATASVHGTVTWKGSGRPVHRARVLFRLLPEGVVGRRQDGNERFPLVISGSLDFVAELSVSPGNLDDPSISKEDGSYVLAGLPVGKPYRLSVQLPDSLCDVVNENFPADAPSGQPGTYPSLQEGEDCRRDVTLQADMWSIRARILRPDGSLVREGDLYLGRSDASTAFDAHFLGPLGRSFTQRDEDLGPDGRYEIVGGFDLRRWPVEETNLFLNVDGFPVEVLSLSILRRDPIGHCFLVDLTLRQGRTIRGTVLGPDGRAVPGATVYGWNSGDLPRFGLQTCTADDNGSFRLEGLPEGKPLVLWAQHVAPAKDLGAVLALAAMKQPLKISGDTPWSALAAMEQPFEVSEDAPGPFTLRLDARGEVSGRILVDGKPMADVLVDGQLPDGVVPMRVSRRVRTDPEGHYVFEGLPHWGNLRVRLMQDVGLPREARARSVPVGSRDVDFAGQRPPGTGKADPASLWEISP